MPIPPDHPQRDLLHNEVHARPPESLTPPERVVYLALLCTPADISASETALRALCADCNAPPPPPDARHYRLETTAFRLKWERHSEFVSYSFYSHHSDAPPFTTPPLAGLPEDWLATLPGQTLVAIQAAILPGSGELPNGEALAPLFAGNTLIGASIAGGAGAAFTDFQLHTERFSRFYLLDLALTRRQAGRFLQRLCEIETYRMMALLAFPVAQAISKKLDHVDAQLQMLTQTMPQASRADEPALLDQLTRLAATLESDLSATAYRFSAAQAYYDLVERRIDSLREERIEGLQTFAEFMDRRLRPAMNTCRAATARQYALSERLAQASQLLRTRVDISREQQNQDLLASMDRRAQLQLRLQETVEGLSVAAITYYTVGLIGYLAKAAKAAGLPIAPDLLTGAAIPVVAVGVALSIRHIRKAVTGGHG